MTTHSRRDHRNHWRYNDSTRARRARAQAQGSRAWRGCARERCSTHSNHQPQSMTLAGRTSDLHSGVGSSPAHTQITAAAQRRRGCRGDRGVGGRPSGTNAARHPPTTAQAGRPAQPPRHGRRRVGSAPHTLTVACERQRHSEHATAHDTARGTARKRDATNEKFTKKRRAHAQPDASATPTQPQARSRMHLVQCKQWVRASGRAAGRRQQPVSSTESRGWALHDNDNDNDGSLTTGGGGGRSDAGSDTHSATVQRAASNGAATTPTTYRRRGGLSRAQTSELHL
jgi:hypothetical protein